MTFPPVASQAQGWPRKFTESATRRARTQSSKTRGSNSGVHVTAGSSSVLRSQACRPPSACQHTMDTQSTADAENRTRIIPQKKRSYHTCCVCEPENTLRGRSQAQRPLGPDYLSTGHPEEANAWRQDEWSPGTEKEGLGVTANGDMGSFGGTGMSGTR